MDEQYVIKELGDVFQEGMERVPLVVEITGAADGWSHWRTFASADLRRLRFCVPPQRRNKPTRSQPRIAGLLDS